MMELLKETELNIEQKDMIKTAEVCSQQLVTVINDILEISKLDANKVKLEEVSHVCNY